MTVQQHMYGRHRIRLMFPRLKCIVETSKSGHRKYYPIELVEIYTEKEERSNEMLYAAPSSTGGGDNLWIDESEDGDGNKENQAPPTKNKCTSGPSWCFNTAAGSAANHWGSLY